MESYLNRAAFFTILTWLLLPTVAFAQDVPVLKAIVAGSLLPVFVLSHLLACLSAGLLLGQNKILPNRDLFFLLIATFIVGFSISWQFSLPIRVHYILGCSTLTALLVVLDLKRFKNIRLLIAIAILFILTLDASWIGLTGVARLCAMIGNAIGISTLVLSVSVLAQFFIKREWQRIGLRIIASWIATISLFLLANYLLPFF